MGQKRGEIHATRGECHVASRVFRVLVMRVYFTVFFFFFLSFLFLFLSLSKITGYSQSKSLPTSLFSFCLVNVSFSCFAVSQFDSTKA